jgi:hypothetical protein
MIVCACEPSSHSSGLNRFHPLTFDSFPDRMGRDGTFWDVLGFVLTAVLRAL